MAAPNRHPSLPKPDLSRPGQYHPITREGAPGAFRTDEELAEINARSAETQAYLQPPQGGATTAPAARLPEIDPEWSNSPSEPDDSGDSDYSPGPARRKSARVAQALTQAFGDDDDDVDDGSPLTDIEIAEADEEVSDEDNTDFAAPLEVDDKGWKVNNPKIQPLIFATPTDLVGGKVYKTIKFQVDFNDNKSVAKANKARRQVVGRANNNIGAPLKRRSTVGHEYSQLNDNWITAEHASFAAANNGGRIPMPELTRRYNAQFPLENRTQASLNSHIDHKPALKNMRHGYNAYY